MRARSEPPRGFASGEANGVTAGGRGAPAREAPQPAEDEVFALGGWLAKQRELRGIRLEELAALTRLPVRSLERLEAGAFDGQRDGFVRGFVRTVAVAIGLDPDDAVARLLAEEAIRPGRRLPDLRRLAVGAAGLAAALALGLAILELARSPGEVANAAAKTTLVRRDAVRALAAEHGLLSGDPSSAGPPAVLLPGAEPRRGLPLGAPAPDAPEAPPDSPE